jgi:hypothetical protein
MAQRRLRDAGALPLSGSYAVEKRDRLDDLVRNEQKAREQAASCEDITARIAHLGRAALYAGMIKAMRL